jgi:hypothetical protein
MQNVHITYQRETLLPFVQALQGQLATQPEEVAVLDYGYSQKSVHGYVVLEWIDEVDETFLAQLNGE